MTVGELQARMGHAEMQEWQAFCAVEPLPGPRADLHAALIATLLGNAHRDTTKRPKPYTADDFLVRFWPELRPEAVPVSLKDKFMAATSRMPHDHAG